MRNRIKLGVEIELIYNRDIVRFNKGSYHNGIKKGRYWSLEEDGSLSRHRSDFINSDSIEFVSTVFCSKKLFIKGLEEFKSFFGSHELNKVIDFNTSCGCHLHIGLNNEQKYTDVLGYDELITLRRKFFNSIKKSTVLSDETKNKILRHYFRDYAKKITRELINNSWDNSRYLEFNKRSENDHKGLEWRSLNLYGVKTWRDFFEVMTIFYNCAYKLFVLRTKGFKQKKKTTILYPTEYKNVIIPKNKINTSLCVTTYT